MCLRSTGAEILRRMNDLEQSLEASIANTTVNTTTTTTTTSSRSMLTARAISSQSPQILRLTSSSDNKKSSQNRFISRSVQNFHSLTPKNRPSNGHALCPTDENGNQTLSNGITLFNDKN
ncbi:unnamed protein product, partial [Cercopithifilaria johnstoni]